MPNTKFTGTLNTWIGIIGTVITLILTIMNNNTKSLIDKREEELKTLEYKLKERSTQLDESKEKIERYKWVLTLFPEIEGKNEKKKNFSISLIRLALTKDEAQQLFTGLQASDNKELQNVGQTGINVIENEPIALLVSQMNASTASARKHAVAQLKREYRSSSQAVNLVLGLFDDSKINNLSPSGVINGLYFLSDTDPDAWEQKSILAGTQIITRLGSKELGTQTRSSLTTFQKFLKNVPGN